MKKLMICITLILCSFIAASCSQNHDIMQAQALNGENNNENSSEGNSTLSDSNNGVQPLRIIAGTVAAIQYLDFLNVDLAGRIHTTYGLPERYIELPTVGLPMSPNTELILSLEPDIYVGELVLQPVMEEVLHTADTVEVIYLNGSTYQSIEDNINLLCERLQIPNRASEIKEIMEENLNRAKELADGKSSPEVAVLFGSPASFRLATGLTFTGDVLKQIGAVNIADTADSDSGYIYFDREKLLELDPDILLRLSVGNSDMLEEQKRTFDEAFQENYWQGFTAVQNGRVYDLDPDIFNVTGNLNSIEAPAILAEIIYGADV